MSGEYCTGRDGHILVKEIDSKVWHDDDLYYAECSKCGAKRYKQLSRRASQVIIACEEVDWWDEFCKDVEGNRYNKNLKGGN